MELSQTVVTVVGLGLSIGVIWFFFFSQQQRK